MCKGVFMIYQRGKHTQRNNQILIRIEGIKNRREVASFIGRKVVWNKPRKKSLSGTIIGVHG